MSSVLGARERERARQTELESERLRERVEFLEISLRAARAEHDKAMAAARWQVASANERARQAKSRADALEEAMAASAGFERARASLPASAPSPLASPLRIAPRLAPRRAATPLATARSTPRAAARRSARSRS